MNSEREKLLTAEIGLPHEVIRQKITGSIA